VPVTEAPQAYHPSPPGTRKARWPEIIAFIMKYAAENEGKLASAKIIIAKTSAKHGAELTPVRDKLRARGLLTGKGQWCKIVLK